MSKLKGPGNGVYIKNYIVEKLPPMTWNIVAIKVMKLMVKHKLKATSVTPNDEFPDEVIDAINDVLETNYNTSLPKF